MLKKGLLSIFFAFIGCQTLLIQSSESASSLDNPPAMSSSLYGRHVAVTIEVPDVYYDDSYSVERELFFNLLAPFPPHCDIADQTRSTVHVNHGKLHDTGSWSGLKSIRYAFD